MRIIETKKNDCNSRTRSMESERFFIILVRFNWYVKLLIKKKKLKKKSNYTKFYINNQVNEFYIR